VVADGVDPLTVEYQDYADQMSSAPLVIGHEWKTFDFMVGWLIDLDRAQFVETREGDLYKIVFFDFEGSSTGVTTLERSQIGNTSTDETVESASLSLFPNPTSDYVLVQSQVDEQIRLTWFDRSGRLVGVNQSFTNTQVAVPEITSGHYYLSVQGEAISKTFAVQVLR